MFRTTILGLAGTALALTLVSAPHAKPLMEANISMEDAMLAYEAAVAECKKSNSNDISVVVVDRAGQVALIARSNNAAPHNLDLARRKAYTARTFRTTTTQWRDRTSGNQAGAGQRQLAEVIPLGGGVPILIGQDAIGGVGVSGSNGGQPGDEACAKAGADAVVAAAAQ